MNNAVLMTLGIVHRINPNGLKEINVGIDDDMVITNYVFYLNGEEWTYGHSYPINGNEYDYKKFIEKTYVNFLTSIVKKEEESKVQLSPTQE